MISKCNVCRGFARKTDLRFFPPPLLLISCAQAREVQHEKDLREKRTERYFFAPFFPLVETLAGWHFALTGAGQGIKRERKEKAGEKSLWLLVTKDAHTSDGATNAIQSIEVDTDTHWTTASVSKSLTRSPWNLGSCTFSSIPMNVYMYT